MPAPAPKPGSNVADRPKQRLIPRKAERSQELRFKVTDSFKQGFKQAARDLGVKKTALLERLLAEWQQRSAVGGAVRPAAAKADNIAPASAGKPARRAKAALSEKPKPART